MERSYRLLISNCTLLFFLFINAQTIVFHEVVPFAYEDIRLCKIDIPPDLELCIKETFEKTNCRLVQLDSNETFIVFVYLETDSVIFTDVPFDLCKDYRCMMNIFLTDQIHVSYISEEEERYWKMRGYFEIRGDLFFVEASEGDVNRFFKEKDDTTKWVFNGESTYMPVTGTCTDMRIPVIDDASDFLRSGRGWPLLKIEIENGRIVSCEFECEEDKVLHGIKIKID